MFSTKGGFVYIMTNKNHTVLYTGVTSKLEQRVEQHINGVYKGSFTSKYHCNKLVYYCGFPYIAYAIAEEKRIKAGSRKQKIGLIESINPNWDDLSVRFRMKE
jgi:putative endonuclease